MRYGLRADAKSLVDVYEMTRAQGFGEEVKRRVMIGTYVLSAGYYDAYYLKALKVRRRIADDFEQAFQKVDALLTPTAPSAAFGLGQASADPVAMYLNDVFTVPVNLAGLPGISVPAGLDAQGLPLGLQVITRPLDEGTLFSLGGALEQAAAFGHKPERWWV
jgi:aspartyl-tRNA(Asn)/glutamyl-tRNA(Gln) amidotransferase subunit A